MWSSNIASSCTVALSVLAALTPQLTVADIYNGGCSGNGTVKLRISNGGAGQSGLVKGS